MQRAIYDLERTADRERVRFEATLCFKFVLFLAFTLTFQMNKRDIGSIWLLSVSSMNSS